MAGARQREMAARQEVGGAEPRDLRTDRPCTVSETAGTSHGRTSTHARNCTDEWSNGPSSPAKHPPISRRPRKFAASGSPM
jgi:hypothetical protein